MDTNQLSLKNKSPLASIVKFNGIAPKVPDSVFLADGARVIGDVELGENCSIWFNTVVRGDVHTIKVGKNTNIQDNALIHCTYKKSPTLIGDNVSIAHLAIVHGCTIENGCLIGMGAIVMDNAVVGENSIVGAGAVVTQGFVIPAKSLVLGSPAKVIRTLKREELEKIHATTERYMEYTKGFDFSQT